MPNERAEFGGQDEMPQAVLFLSANPAEILVRVSGLDARGHKGASSVLGRGGRMSSKPKLAHDWFPEGAVLERHHRQAQAQDCKLPSLGRGQSAP